MENQNKKIPVTVKILNQNYDVYCDENEREMLMKSAELKEMNKLELETKLNDNLEALQNLKFQKALQQLEDGTMISKTKKEIAQIKTVLNEFNLGIRVEEGVK